MFCIFKTDENITLMLLSSLWFPSSVFPCFRLLFIFFSLSISLELLFFLAFLHIFSFHFSLPFPYDVFFCLFPTYPSPLTSMHSSLIQLGEEKFTTSSPACQQRTSIVPWVEGKTKIILFAEIHSRDISSGKGSFPQEKKKKKKKKPCEDNKDCNKCQQQLYMVS